MAHCGGVSAFLVQVNYPCGPDERQ